MPEVEQMSLNGSQLLAGEPSRESDQVFHASDPRSGAALEPSFAEATSAEVDRAVQAAMAAHPRFELAGRERRAEFLERAAQNIVDLGDALIERCDAETGLGTARLSGERGRTVNQLRLFAEVVRRGDYLDIRIDRALPDRTPVPRPDLRRTQRAIGPVVVFAASNFPLAFSVAGGDTASALAAGCPVIAKGHPHHPGTCEMIAGAVSAAAKALDLPPGVFSLIQGIGHEVGRALVTHPGVGAVGFTGSLRGGRALFDAACSRPNPIPFFGELGSSNPVVILPSAVRERASALTDGLVGSLCLGAGQFCTNPGLLFLIEGPETDALLTQLAERVEAQSPATMLHAGTHAAYEARVAELEASGARRLDTPRETDAANSAVPALFRCSASEYLERAPLRDEVFGPCTLAVTVAHRDELSTTIAAIEGQLTATIHTGTAEPTESLAELVEILGQKVGRVLFGGFPTGVEVSDAMQHGGPYPATTDSRSTSVGTAAIDRFLRPVCYQNFPQELLPAELRDEPRPEVRRLIDGRWAR